MQEEIHYSICIGNLVTIKGSTINDLAGARRKNRKWIYFFRWNTFWEWFFPGEGLLRFFFREAFWNLFFPGGGFDFFFPYMSQSKNCPIFFSLMKIFLDLYFPGEGLLRFIFSGEGPPIFFFRFPPGPPPPQIINGRPLTSFYIFQGPVRKVSLHTCITVWYKVICGLYRNLAILSHHWNCRIKLTFKTWHHIKNQAYLSFSVTGAPVNKGLIFLAIAGLLVVLCLAVFGVYLSIRRVRKTQSKSSDNTCSTPVNEEALRGKSNVSFFCIPHLYMGPTIRQN